MVAITFNVVVFPYEIAFNPTGDVCFADKPSMATVTLVFDAALWVQVFVTGYHAYQAKRRDLETSALLPTSPILDKLGALRGSLFSCLVMLPYDWLVSGDASCFTSGHLARALLIARLHSVCSRAVDGAFPALGSRRAAARLIQLFTTALIFLHWYGCVQYVVSMRLVPESSGPGGTLSWAQADELEARPMWARYLRSFDRGLLVVMGEGVHGRTDAEIAVSLIGLLVGTGLVAFATSLIVQEVTSTNNREGRTREKIGRVEAYLRSASLPKELRVRCLHHMKHVLLSRQLTVDTAELLQDLSQPLREEVALHCCQKLVVNLLHVLDLGHKVDLLLIKSLVSHLQLKIFSPGDELFVEGEEGLEVYFIESGLVVVELSEGHELARRTTGACVGEIALLTGEPRSATCRALTFCETYALSRSSFASVLENHVELAQRVGQMARQRSLETMKARNAALLNDRANTLRSQTRSHMMPNWLTDEALQRQSRVSLGMQQAAEIGALSSGSPEGGRHSGKGHKADVPVPSSEQLLRASSPDGSFKRSTAAAGTVAGLRKLEQESPSSLPPPESLPAPTAAGATLDDLLGPPAPGVGPPTPARPSGDPGRSSWSISSFFNPGARKRSIDDSLSA